MKRIIFLLNKGFHFYYDGFRSMSGWGRQVWFIILIKLFIMFAILKIFFFQDFLSKKFDNNKDRSEHVINQLIKSSGSNDR